MQVDLQYRLTGTRQCTSSRTWIWPPMQFMRLTVRNPPPSVPQYMEVRSFSVIVLRVLPPDPLLSSLHYGLNCIVLATPSAQSASAHHYLKGVGINSRPSINLNYVQTPFIRSSMTLTGNNPHSLENAYATDQAVPAYVGPGQINLERSLAVRKLFSIPVPRTSSRRYQPPNIGWE